MNPTVPPRLDSAAPSKPLPPTPDRGSSHREALSKTPNKYDIPPMPPMPSGSDNSSLGEYAAGWEAQEEMRQRELEEARARAAQMEKTMRWWSDCTSNWREKWSKVRNERNKAREECKQLRFKLEHVAKECMSLKRERENTSSELLTLKKQLEVYVNLEKERASVCSSGSHRSNASEQDTTSNIEFKDSDKESSSQNLNEDFVTKLLSKSETSEQEDESKVGAEVAALPSGQSVISKHNYDAIEVKLNEMKKALREEQLKNAGLSQAAESSQNEAGMWKKKCDEITKNADDAAKQLADARLIRFAPVRPNEESEDELAGEVDMRLTELRKELERLQAENAIEWTKSERLETEKLALERETRKLKTEVENLQEELDEKTKNTAKLLDSDKKAVEMELVKKTKDLHDLKHAHSKSKKLLQEKTAELDHALSRGDQYETEVKKLRSRIEELKRELASAEDEADQQAHQVRKLLRTNDEIQQQNESLSVRVQHLQTRLKSASQPSLLGHGGTRTSSLKNFDLSFSPTDGNSDVDQDDQDN